MLLVRSNLGAYKITLSSLIPLPGTLCSFALAAMKKIVLKVSMQGQNCKRTVLKAVTKLTGINQVTVDGEKGTLTVVGEVDPVLLTETLRKSGKYAEIVSVGPPKPPEPKSPQKIPAPPPWYIDYQMVPVGHVPYDSGPCSIL